MAPATRSVFLERIPLSERSFLLSVLRQETVGGALLLAAAVLAIVWANSPWAEAYETLRETHLGPASLHLDLTVEEWAADGLLAIFFFVAGLELKRELVVGQLSKPAAAALPIVAAGCGMAAPALVYLVVTRGEPGTASGWAVPTATDIAFALAVLAVIGSHLPGALRAFLLTLAIVDDLGAILIIALFYTSDLQVWALGATVALLAVYALLQRLRVRAWWIYVPLAVLAWALLHQSGVHATIAGVSLGLLTRVRPDPDEHHSPAERLEHRILPLSAGVAVPFFALMSAGVAVSGEDLANVFGDRAALGVMIGLVLGKLLGVFGGTWLAVRFTRAELNRDLRWADIAAVSLLAGIGFTVALLIGELAFEGDPERAEHVKAGILIGSLTAAVLASIALTARNRHYKRLDTEDNQDLDADGVPDVYQQRPGGQTGDT
jgi:Na+:H+ antiporter, NhaA family